MSGEDTPRLVYVNDITQEEFAVLLAGLREHQNYYEGDGALFKTMGKEYCERQCAFIDSLRTRLSLSWTATHSPFRERETAHVLAGLRLLQRLGSYTAGIDDVMTDGGQFTEMSPEEIDALCEKVNSM